MEDQESESIKMILCPKIMMRILVVWMLMKLYIIITVSHCECNNSCVRLNFRLGLAAFEDEQTKHEMLVQMLLEVHTYFWLEWILVFSHIGACVKKRNEESLKVLLYAESTHRHHRNSYMYVIDADQELPKSNVPANEGVTW